MHSMLKIKSIFWGKHTECSIVTVKFFFLAQWWLEVLLFLFLVAD